MDVNCSLYLLHLSSAQKWKKTTLKTVLLPLTTTHDLHMYQYKVQYNMRTISLKVTSCDDELSSLFRYLMRFLAK